jgi:carboxypeptidase Taq
MTQEVYIRLEKYFEKYSIMNDIKSILNWDSNVNLPENSLPARTRQMELMEGDISNFLKSDDLKNLLVDIDSNELDQWQKKNLQLIRKTKEENEIYPKELLEQIASSSMKCEYIWREAKKENNFSIVKNEFKTLLGLIKEQAARRGDWLGKNQYESLMDMYCPGLKVITTDKIFNELKEKLPEIISKLEKASDKSTKEPIKLKEEASFDEIAKTISISMGFDLKSGRIDKTTHPFCGGYSGDIRITHDYNGKNFISALYAIIHETGHGLYEQNLPKEFLYQSVGNACGYAAHEASALLHEFFIGKSKYFLKNIEEVIQNYATNYESEILFREVKEIKFNNPIRIHADMVTYPLHIILRYELEKLLFNDELKIEDLPSAWKEKHKKLLGFEIQKDSDGCLQDIHWYLGAFGYFPSYCIGLIYAAQMYYLLGFTEAQTMEDSKNKFQSLKQRFYSNASLYEFEELVKKATGKELNASYYYKFVNSEY